MRFGFLLKRGKPEARELAAELGRCPREDEAARWWRWPRTVRAAPEAHASSRARSWGGRSTPWSCWAGTGRSCWERAWSPTTACRCFGVNLGSLGFITHYARAEAAAALDAAPPRASCPSRSACGCRCTIGTPDGPGRARTAVNDAVLTQRSLARLLDLEARLDGAEIATYKADGLIVVDADGLDGVHAGGRRAHPDAGSARPSR